MSDFKKFNDRVWDRFFEFIDAGDVPTDPIEVEEELKLRGIDVVPAARRVLEAVRASEAQSALARARTERPAVLKKLADVDVPAGLPLRDRLRQLIKERFVGTAQAAFYRKLEKAASDQDLQTLLEDIERLGLLDQEDGNGEG